MQEIENLFRDQEHQLSVAQRLAHCGSWSWDLLKNQVSGSEEVFRIFGLEPQDFPVPYDKFLKSIHPEDREFVEAQVSESINKKKPYLVEYRVLQPSGSIRTVYGTGEVQYDQEGNAIEMIGVVQDITERKQAESSLRKSEAKFRGLLDTAYDTIIIVNSEGFIEFANQPTKQWFGYDPAELIGQPIECLIPERFQAQHTKDRLQYSKKPFARSMGQKHNLIAKRKNGTEFPVDISLSPVQTDNGLLMTAFIRDITELRKSQDQQQFLLETSRILSETVDYLDRAKKIANLVVPKLCDICIIHLIEDGRLAPKAVSSSNLQDPKVLWDLSNSDIVMRESAHYGPPYVGTHQCSQFLEHVTDEILQDVAQNPVEFQQLKSIGMQSYIGVPLRARGHLIGVASFIRQIPNQFEASDLAFAELVGTRVAIALDNAKLFQDVQNAAQLREDVLAIVSHDLKNPLGIIEGFNQVIKDTSLPSEFQDSIRPATEAIDRSIHRMKKLIGDLLDFAQIQSGSLSVLFSNTSPVQLVLDGIESVEPFAAQKHIQISSHLQKNLPDVACDPDRIRQVFSNILGNAIKFANENSQIRIRAYLSESEILFSVHNEGPEIAKGHLPFLFDRYWRARETSKQGTGLGLSIANGIIKSHHGRIWAESSQANGTTFYFTLPLSDTINQGRLPRQKVQMDSSI